MATSESSPEAGLPGSLSNSVPQKRNRIQLSCTLCRQAKLKCNRVRPACDQCIKRTRTEQCYYAPPPVRRQPPQDMRGRVRHLERLIVDLMQTKGNGGTNGVQSRNGSSAGENGQVNGSSAENGEPNDQERAAEALGKMKISKNESIYIGSSHWAAILKDIEDVKEYLNEDQCDSEDDDDCDDETQSPPRIDNRWGYHSSTKDLEMMVGRGGARSKAQLLEEMPERPVVDRLIAEWFNSADPFLHIVHAPTFGEEYKNFWKAPQRTPTMWIGLLYGIMSLSVFFRYRSEGDGCKPSKAITETIDRYLDLATSAMVLADYTGGKPYTIECMLVSASNQYLLSADRQDRVWITLGLTIRLALRMGYHRDPSHFPEIPFLQGEMRRRIWHLLTQLDVLISFQQGLPSMIRALPSDISPPHNLRDSDFDANTKVPPTPRPLSEMTPVSYSIAKWRICAVFAEACETSHAVTPPTYGEVLDLDKRMREAYGLIPPALRVRPMDQSVTDTPEAIMCRFNLELLYLKSQCVLHRRYLNERQTDTRHTYSRKTCLEAAVECLKYHETIHEAVQPGGRLERFRWYMSSITSHNFLLAAMILCLELTFYHEADATAASVMRDQLSWNQEEAIALLQKSYSIWKQVSGLSKDAAKACSILGVLLKKVKAAPNPIHSSDLSPNSSDESNESFESSGTSGLASFNGVEINPSMLPPERQLSSTGEPMTSNPDDFAPIGEMLDMPANINWSMWDTQIQAQQLGIINPADDSWPMDLDISDVLQPEGAYMQGPDDFTIPDPILNRF
ncbi:MAG: hypothetical protein M1822_001800 [Bathelium mastoideum]|nr:MAG: hypothetical protein M1822_001800 [Bathelium mastoideum]